MQINYVFRGELKSEGEILRYAPQNKPKEKDKNKPKKHKGFIVKGYPPEQINSAKAAAKNEHKIFDEAEFIRKNRKKRFTIPFNLPEAAQICADIAMRQGWLHVEIYEPVKAQYD